MRLADPGWLLLLVLLPLLGVGALLVARMRKSQWHAFVAPRLRGALIRRGSSLPRWLALAFILLACGALIAALSRPQGDAGVKTEETLGRNVLVALDLSRSMRVDDVKPDRLSQAKIAIYELLEALPQDRVGLIGFAGTAYLYAPLTIDHAGVRQTVEQIDETWPSVGGSNLAEAIRLAVQTLKQTGQKNNALVILSDGEHHEGDLDAMISEAESSGVFIYAIGVGTENGGMVPAQNAGNGFLMPGRQEKSTLSRLQPDVMRKLATETGGRFAVAGSGADLPGMIRSAVQEMDAFKVEGRERRISTEFFQWLLLPGIVALMVSVISGTRWRGVKAAVMILGGAFLFSPQASAGDVSRAKDALAGKRYKEARETYKKLAEDAILSGRAARYRLGEATAAYREKDFRGARSAFSEAMLSRDKDVSSSAHLGMGNTLFQLGWQGLSGEAYPPASASPPDLAKFDELANKLLEDLQKGDAPENGNSEEYTRLEALIVNWSDAVRHYDSSIRNDPANQGAARNRSTAVAYLKRLRELLDQEKNETQQSMPQQGPGLQGQGPPQKGSGQPGDEPGEGEGEDDGDGQGDEEEGDGEEGDKDRDGRGGEDKKEEPSDKGANPNESPEDHARRRLSENADLEKGPLSQRNMEFRNPEKDW